MRINDRYEISIDGKVKNTKTCRILKICLAGPGKYECLRLGVGKHHYIHKLVANAYLPAPTEEGCEIDHIDRNKYNNHASNLRWVSKSVNAQNKNIENKPRISNKHGEHHIKKIMGQRQITPSYIVVYNLVNFKHYSCHKTLEEAIEKRNSIII